MKTILLLALISIFTIKSCSEESDIQDPLKQVLLQEDPYIRQVMDNVKEHELQIIYTRIEREDDSLILKDYKFQVNQDNYFIGVYA